MHLDYDHPEPDALCRGRSDLYGMETAKTAPVMKAGSTTVLAWAGDE
jgi:hypothetical protein